MSVAQGKRVELSAAQRTEVWCRWKTGQSLHEIGRAFGKPHTSIHCLPTPIVSCGCLKISFLFFARVIVFFTAGLLSLVLRARRLLGAYRIPMETGPPIPSGNRCYWRCGVLVHPASRG